MTSMQVQLDKISAKVEDKIILFNPLEIDYIEARDGQTYLFVNDEEFASSSTIKTFMGLSSFIFMNLFFLISLSLLFGWESPFSALQDGIESRKLVEKTKQQLSAFCLLSNDSCHY